VATRSGTTSTGVDQQLERIDVRFAQAEPDRHRLPEDRALEIDAPQGANHALDTGSSFHLDKCSSSGNYLRCADNALECWMAQVTA
jgi:hypothetical protein